MLTKYTLYLIIIIYKSNIMIFLSCHLNSNINKFHSVLYKICVFNTHILLKHIASFEFTNWILMTNNNKHRATICFIYKYHIYLWKNERTVSFPSEKCCKENTFISDLPWGHYISWKRRHLTQSEPDPLSLLSILD